MSSSEKSKADSVSDKQGTHAVTENLFTDDAVDPIYQAKARILNNAIQEIGMGRYQVPFPFLAVATSSSDSLPVGVVRSCGFWMARR